MLRRAWPFVAGILACGAVWHLFDWAAVGAALRGLEVMAFLPAALTATLGLMLARSLRWAAVSGLPFTPASLWRIHLQTAVSMGIAAVTPMQAGEALKLKLARDRSGGGWAPLAAGFVLERLADVAALLGLGALGFGLRGAAAPWLMLAALGLAIGVAAAPAILRRLAMAGLPRPIAAMLAPLRDYRPAGWRMALLGLCTVGAWFCTLLLWQVTLAAGGIALGLADCALAMALVTLAVIVSLVPGGLGVAEVSTRAVLLWLGVEPGQADAGAVLLRLLTPLVVLVGLAHGLALITTRGR